MLYQLVEDVWSNNSDRSFYDKLNQCCGVLSAWGHEVTGSFKQRINQSKKIMKALKGRRDEDSITAAKEKKRSFRKLTLS